MYTESMDDVRRVRPVAVSSDLVLARTWLDIITMRYNLSSFVIESQQ